MSDQSKENNIRFIWLSNKQRNIFRFFSFCFESPLINREIQFSKQPRCQYTNYSSSEILRAYINDFNGKSEHWNNFDRSNPLRIVLQYLTVDFRGEWTGWNRLRVRKDQEKNCIHTRWRGTLFLKTELSLAGIPKLLLKGQKQSRIVANIVSRASRNAVTKLLVAFAIFGQRKKTPLASPSIHPSVTRCKFQQELLTMPRFLREELSRLVFLDHVSTI